MRLPEGIVLTIRAPSGAVISRSSLALDGPAPMIEWLERWATVVGEPGVSVLLEADDGELLGELTDTGLSLTTLGAAPLLVGFGLFGIVE